MTEDLLQSANEWLRNSNYGRYELMACRYFGVRLEEFPNMDPDIYFKYLLGAKYIYETENGVEL